MTLFCMLLVVLLLKLHERLQAPNQQAPSIFVYIMMACNVLAIVVTMVVLGYRATHELDPYRKALRDSETGEMVNPPALEQLGKDYHLFISHSWDNQDTAAVLKRQLQLLLPSCSIFLDVDDLEDIHKLEMHVRESAAMLVLLGSSKYFSSANCQREFHEARKLDLPLLLLHDADASKNGEPLEALKKACPEEHHALLFGERTKVLPWHRVADFQMLTLAELAEDLICRLHAPARGSTVARFSVRSSRSENRGRVSFRVPEAIAWKIPRLKRQVRLYVSEHNQDAAAIARRLRDTFSSHDFGLQIVEKAERTQQDCWLLLLSAHCFQGKDGLKLEAEVYDELHKGNRSLVTIYQPAEGEFSRIISAAPPRLSDKALEQKLFDVLAIEWHDEQPLYKVSLRLVAKAIGATLIEPSFSRRRRSSSAGFFARALPFKSGRGRDFFSRFGAEGAAGGPRQTEQYTSRGGRVVIRPTADSAPDSCEGPKSRRVSFADQVGNGVELQRMASRGRSEKL